MGKARLGALIRAVFLWGNLLYIGEAMLSEDDLVRRAREQQRAMTDGEVLALYVSWGNPPSDDIEGIRELLTNVFYDDLRDEFHGNGERNA